jgi:glycerate 2-kinase
MSAPEVVAAIAAGVERAGREARLRPVADGGDGTAEILRLALGGRRIRASATDALGRPMTAGFVLLDDGRAAVDAAEASGLARLDRTDALAASSRGTGELIVAAVRAGADSVLLGAGGSACTDGAAGILAALHEAAVTPPITVICDVAVPFEEAAPIFAPQKGASPAEVEVLAARLEALAVAAPRDPRGVPMTGAAGGLSGGLWAYADAKLVPGADFVLDAIDFDSAVTGASLVLTGEGRLDPQTAHGKAVGEVAARSRRAGVRCAALVGADALGPAAAGKLGLAAVAEAGTPTDLAAAARELVEGLVG